MSSGERFFALIKQRWSFFGQKSGKLFGAVMVGVSDLVTLYHLSSLVVVANSCVLLTIICRAVY